MNNVKISVACIVYNSDDAILLVKERQVIGVVYNQPAGHLQPGETLLAGAVREVQERTGMTVEVEYLLGIYERYFEETGSHVVRFCFVAKSPKRQDIAIDFQNIEIISADYYEKSEMKKLEKKFRNPLVKQCVDDFYKGFRFDAGCVKFV